MHRPQQHTHTYSSFLRMCTDMGAKVSDEIEAVVMRKFGDEQSSLLDKFERLSFEAQLNKAMRLGRSLSEPGAMVRAKLTPASAAGPARENFSAQPAAPEPFLAPEVRNGWRSRRRRAAALKNMLKKLLRPIVGFGSGKKEVMVTDPKDPRFWKDFSRSMRF